MENPFNIFLAPCEKPAEISARMWVFLFFLLFCFCASKIDGWVSGLTQPIFHDSIKLVEACRIWTNSLSLAGLGEVPFKMVELWQCDLFDSFYVAGLTRIVWVKACQIGGSQLSLPILVSMLINGTTFCVNQEFVQVHSNSCSYIHSEAQFLLVLSLLSSIFWYL